MIKSLECIKKIHVYWCLLISTLILFEIGFNSNYNNYNELKKKKERFASISNELSDLKFEKNMRIKAIENSIDKIESIYMATGGYLREVVKKVENEEDDVIFDINNIPEERREIIYRELVEVHGLKNYKKRYDSFLFPVPNIEEAFIGMPDGEYGWRTDGVNWYKHYGIDIGCRYDRSIIASADGNVIGIGYTTNGGNYILISHYIVGVYWITYYGHLDVIKVARNDEVIQGQEIGVMGETGKLCRGIHLHFELKKKYGADYHPINFVINTTWKRVVVNRL